MICDKYEALTTVEKVIYIGQLHHAIMSRNEYFEIGQKIIELGKLSGIFENVEILPETNS